MADGGGSMVLGGDDDDDDDAVVVVVDSQLAVVGIRSMTKSMSRAKSGSSMNCAVCFRLTSACLDDVGDTVALMPSSISPYPIV